MVMTVPYKVQWNKPGSGTIFRTPQPVLTVGSGHDRTEPSSPAAAGTEGRNGHCTAVSSLLLYGCGVPLAGKAIPYKKSVNLLVGHGLDRAASVRIIPINLTLVSHPLSRKAHFYTPLRVRPAACALRTSECPGCFLLHKLEKYPQRNHKISEKIERSEEPQDHF